MILKRGLIPIQGAELQADFEVLKLSYEGDDRKGKASVGRAASDIR
jgi:hypothetical protein